MKRSPSLDRQNELTLKLSKYSILNVILSYCFFIKSHPDMSKQHSKNDHTASPLGNTSCTMLLYQPYCCLEKAALLTHRKKQCFLYCNNGLNEKACSHFHKPNYNDNQSSADFSPTCVNVDIQTHVLINYMEAA